MTDFYARTGLLDAFNRADAGDLGSYWVNNFASQGLSGLKVSSNQCIPVTPLTTAGAAAWIYPLGSAAEAWVTNAHQSGTNRLYVRLTTLDATANGYNLQWDGANMQFNILNAGTSSLLGSSWSQTITDGDKVGIRISDSTLTAWVDTGSGWQMIQTLSDTTYTSGAYISMLAFGANQIFDDFGGGMFFHSLARLGSFDVDLVRSAWFDPGVPIDGSFAWGLPFSHDFVPVPPQDDALVPSYELPGMIVWQPSVARGASR